VANKARTKEFISTHLVGETAFFDLDMSKATFSDSPADPKTLNDLLALCVRDMVLGESATFAFDIMGTSSYIKDIVRNSGKLHRGHYANVPQDADSMILDLDLFRIYREDSSTGNPNRTIESLATALEWGHCRTACSLSLPTKALPVEHDLTLFMAMIHVF
jgi:hypothetical protein